tara:strand:+ start:897 stop:1175 length:279 start_codon:yes stop_codon:yes gene_type:complete
MSEGKKFKGLRKVSIIGLIDMLKKIYDDGADFIDIMGEQAEEGKEDVIKIEVKPEYYTDEVNNTDPQYMVTEQDYEEEFPPISDEDINDLIK